MMREGQLLSELVGSVAADRGHGVRAETIWLSRQVAARAALDQVSQTSLRPLLARRASPTVEQFVTDLGLSRREADDLPVPVTALMEKPEVIDPVIDSLVASDHLSARILASAADARRRLLGYLDRTVGATEEALVLVDLGWGGTIQHHLAKVFQIAGIRHRILGLYLIVNQVSCDRILDNREITGYLANAGEPWQDVADIGRSPEVIEQACLAPTGSVVDFDDGGEPILDSSTPPADQVVSRLLVQDGTRAFQSEWLRYQASVTSWPRFEGRERPLLRNVLRASVVSPTQDEARVFGAWTHEDNFGVDNRERINPERLAGFVPYLSPLDLAEMEMQDVFWPLGLAAEHDHGLAELTRLVQGQEADTSAFEMDSGRAHAALSADAGSGFGEPQTQALRVNRNGLCFARFSVEDAGIQRLCFVPCDHRAVFRIDLIDLELRLRGSGLPQRLRIEDPVELAGLVYSGCHWLTEGIAFATTEAPQVHIPLVGRAAGIVDAVRMEVGFAVLQLPRDRAVALPPADLTARVTRGLVRARSEAAAGGLRAVGRGALRGLRRSLH